MAQYDAFVLRIWRSIGEQGQQWAGRLEHLQLADSLQFSNLDALLAHLRAIAGPLERPADSEPARIEPSRTSSQRRRMDQ